MLDTGTPAYAIGFALNGVLIAGWIIRFSHLIDYPRSCRAIGAAIVSANSPIGIGIKEGGGRRYLHTSTSTSLDRMMIRRIERTRIFLFERDRRRNRDTLVRG